MPMPKPAAAQGQALAPCLHDDLKHGFGVVIQSAHDVGVDGKGDVPGGQKRLQLLKVLLALIAQAVQDHRGVLHDGLALFFLAVQDTQGVFLEPLLAGGAHFVDALAQIVFQRFMILGPAVGAADGIDVHRQVFKPQPGQETKQGGNQFRFHRGLLAAEAFHAELVMLPQPSALGAFIAENGRVEIIHLAGQGFGEQMVFDKGAHGPGGARAL